MSNEISNKTVDNIEDILQWQREPAPDTRDLQAAIVDQSRSLPQQIENPGKPVRAKLFNIFAPRWMATAACLLVVAVTTTILLPSGSVQSPNLGAEQVTLEELELQELLLLEDEMLFAGI